MTVFIDPSIPSHLAYLLLFSVGEMFLSSSCFELILIPPKPILTK